MSYQFSPGVQLIESALDGALDRRRGRGRSLAERDQAGFEAGDRLLDEGEFDSSTQIRLGCGLAAKDFIR